jgi:hypothetical protein
MLSMMKHSPKNWAIVCWLQLGIIVGGFSLPNHVVNGATWYAPIVDFGRIALLFGFPIGDTILALNLLAIGKRRKLYLRQFIDVSNHIKYDLIDPIYFANLTSKQLDAIELAFNNSRDDLVFDPSFPFESLQHHLQGKTKNV